MELRKTDLPKCRARALRSRLGRTDTRLRAVGHESLFPNAPPLEQHSRGSRVAGSIHHQLPATTYLTRRNDDLLQ